MDEPMNITSAKYIVNAVTGQNGCIEIIVNGQTTTVPLDDANNKEYAEIQRQVAAGTLTIQDAD